MLRVDLWLRSIRILKLIFDLQTLSSVAAADNQRCKTLVCDVQHTKSFAIRFYSVFDHCPVRNDPKKTRDQLRDPLIAFNKINPVLLLEPLRPKSLVPCRNGSRWNALLPRVVSPRPLLSLCFLAIGRDF